MKKTLFIFILLFIIKSILFSGTAYDDKMLDIMIGQMIMIGFKGVKITEDNPVMDDIKKLNIGGIILFEKNIKHLNENNYNENSKKLQKLINELQDNSKIPLFIAIDHEGGKVSRLKSKYGFPETLSHAELGAIDNTLRTETEANRIGLLLKELGINLNFAPVVDINYNPYNPAISQWGRSFSKDPEKVKDHAYAFVKGLHQNDIIICLKHFPGHGSAKKDSHYGMVDITNTWKKNELEPYSYIIKKNKCDMIMLGHLFNKKLDKKMPATFSKNIATELLRKKMGYNGVIITDDLQMKAVTNYYSLKEIVYNSINSGADILMFGYNLDYRPENTQKVVNIIKELIDDRKISRNRIKQSYKRIIKLKKSYFIKDSVTYKINHLYNNLFDYEKK